MEEGVEFIFTQKFNQTFQVWLQKFWVIYLAFREHGMTVNVHWSLAIQTYDRILPCVR